jgi:hypothetical protein
MRGRASSSEYAQGLASFLRSFRGGYESAKSAAPRSKFRATRGRDDDATSANRLWTYGDPIGF